MTRLPFDPMNTAAMKTARAKSLSNPDAPPLSPTEERALIEAAALAAEIYSEESLFLNGGSPNSPLSVKQVNALINQTLSAALPQTFFIHGEISNFRVYDRGHAFFTLKEAGAEMPCVLWKDALNRLKFRPKDGLAVIARGTVKLYEPQGKIQLYVETLFPQGAGALELAFRQLCEKLKSEGLFEPARKRPIPRLPQHLAIITSKTGDVLHDVLTTAFRRYPGLCAFLFPVRVQGDQAPSDIIRAIQSLNTHNARLKLETRNSKPPPFDLILLVRGGGSLEDLWAFNDEALARAICASAIPIATGIGHEPDTTIADLVGDLRGPTPTGVTELTIPDVKNLLADLAAKAALLTRDIRRSLQLASTSLQSLTLETHAAARESFRTRVACVDVLHRKIARIEPRHAIAQGWRRAEESQRKLADALRRRTRLAADRLLTAQDRLDRASPAPALARRHHQLLQLSMRLDSALAARRSAAIQKLAALEIHLRVISPQSVLDRGFSITTDHADNIIRSPDQVKKGDLLKTRLAHGVITSTVGKPKQSSLF